MVITMICPSCGKLATAPRSAAGAKGKCAFCGGAVEVPRHGKNCKVCGKDTAGVKRIKDPEGSYYCATCYEVAKARALNAATPVVPPVFVAAGPAARPAEAPTETAAPALSDPEDDLMLSSALRLDADEAPPAAPAAGAVAETESKRPSHCPNCGTPVVTSGAFCIKCGQDLTKHDVAAKLKDDDDGTAAAERLAGIIGKCMKWGLIVAVAVVIGFCTWLYISAEMHQNDKGLERTTSGALTPREQDRIKGQMTEWARVGMLQAFDGGHLVKVDNIWFRSASHVDPPELVERFSEYFRMKDGNPEVRVINEANNHTVGDRDKAGKVTIYPDKLDFP